MNPNTNPSLLRAALRALALGAVCSQVSTPARADRIWWDGTRDTENAPPGKLLSDNGGYWGERIVTGVEYSYDIPPDNPGDPNKRLLDGVPQGDWNAPVGTANRPIIATFDFKRACTFTEVDLSTRSQKAAFKIEVAEAAQGPFRILLDKTRDEATDKMFHRLALPAPAAGRFLRLTVNAVEPKVGNYLTYLEEVVVWGDSEVSDKAPEAIVPITPTAVITGVAFPSIPGIPRTTFSDADFGKWKWDLGAQGKLPAVWSQVPTWSSITDKPLLPTVKEAGQPVQVSMARNETENAALALTSTDMVNPASGEVSLSAFRAVNGSAAGASRIKASLRIAGAINSRNHGPVIGPLFEADNKPGASLLRRYLTNTEGIKDFPRLTLTPAGSAVLWLSVTSDGAPPGVYQAQLSFSGAGGATSSVPIRVQVLGVTLPDPFVYINTWDHATGQFPFVYADRQAREVAHKQSIGMSVWHQLPSPGTDAELARQNDRAHGRIGKQMYHISVLPYDTINRGFNNQLKPADLTDKDRAAIAESVRAVVKQAKDLGLGYNDWYAEMWDEPGRGNAELYGVLARLVKQTDPKINIYMNPIFWEGNAPAPDDIIAPLLSPFYREVINVSVPHEILMRGYPRSQPLFDATRLVNATYRVSTHGDKDERAPVSYQNQAWDAFGRGYNGWGFYSYYSPEGDPWNDFDSGNPDYIMVYPGPRGPIPSRTSESVREGWEQYRLLSLLKQQGRTAELAALLKDYAGGEAPDKLRTRALMLAAAPATPAAPVKKRR
jgi:hypothetical protein